MMGFDNSSNSGRSGAFGLHRIGAISVFLAASAAMALAQAPAAPQAGTPPVRSQFHEPAAMDFSDHTGFAQIFDGKSLADWEGDPTVWRVAQGPGREGFRPEA